MLALSGLNGFNVIFYAICGAGGICYSAANPRLKLAEPKPLGLGNLVISFQCHRGRVHYGRRTPSSAERRESLALSRCFRFGPLFAGHPSSLPVAALSGDPDRWELGHRCWAG